MLARAAVAIQAQPDAVKRWIIADLHDARAISLATPRIRLHPRSPGRNQAR